METKNLWPDFVIEDSQSPVAILKDQAKYLAEKTNNILVPEVRLGKGNTDHEISCTFYIVAPALQRYRYKLLEIRYQRPYYPLFVSWDSDDQRDIDECDYPVETEEEFIRRIEKIFNYPATVKVISSLMALSIANG